VLGSTTAQEVSKSTEARYTIVAVAAAGPATGQGPRAARRNIIGEFDERSLVNYYTGGPTVRARARARARGCTEKRKLRIPEVHQQRSPERSLFFSSPSSHLLLLSLAGAREEPRCRVGTLADAPAASEFRDYGGREFIKFSTSDV